MKRPQTPEHRQGRITQAEERLRAATMRMSQAHELVTFAKQRLAQARLALQDAQAQDSHDPTADDDPTKASDTP